MGPNLQRTPEMERELDAFLAQHPMNRDAAWAAFVRPMILQRLAGDEPFVPQRWTEARDVSCPHCVGFAGACCQCQGTRLVAFKADLCSWIWEKGVNNGCVACRELARQRPIGRKVA